MSDERRFPLDCGPEVTVQACYYDRTYSRLLEGLPTQKFNHSIFADSMRLADTLWHEKIHLIPPAITMMSGGPRGAYPCLPPERWFVLLKSYWTANPEADCSLLVVVWFQDEAHDRPLFDTIRDAVRGIPWKELAREGWW
jgi:hypothetical protein